MRARVIRPIFAHRFASEAIPLAKYALVGVANTAIDLFLFIALNRGAGLPPVYANVISYSCAVLASFAMNRSFTFGNRSRGRLRVRRQLTRFAMINLAGLLLSTGFIYWLTPRVGAVAAKAGSIPAVMAWGYILSRRMVFRPVR